MITTSRLVGAVIAALLPMSAFAEELRFDRLFVIGDSLSDGGAYSQAVVAGSGGALPNIQYRFTTNAPDGSSQTYAEALADSLGIELQPNIINGVPGAAGTPLAALANDVNVGGTNFAQGGSRTVDQPGIAFNPAGGITTVPLREQIDRLLAGNPGFNSNDLVIVWGGANDVFAQSGAVGAMAITPAVAGANMAAAAQGLAVDVGRLRQAGAQTVLVVTVPDIGQTPFGLQSEAAQPGSGALLTGLTNTFNQTLIAALRGQNAVIVNSQQILSAVQADPARYGFTAPNAATVPGCTVASSLNCVQGFNTLPDSEQRVFADGVHPSTAAHQVFAQAALAGLQAATQTGAIPVATLTALRQQALSLENRLNPTVLFSFDDKGNRRRREVGDIDYFLSAEAGFYDAQAQQITPGLQGSTQVIKAGADIAVASNATIGIGLSLDHGQVDFDGDRGGFDTRLFLGALFGQMALSENFYVNAAGGAGYIDVYNISRSFFLGPSRESYSASSDGTYYFARAGGGAIFPATDEAIINPYAHFTFEQVTIDGFTESMGAASLSFGETEYTSHRVTAGVSATLSPADIPAWKFNFRGSLEHDLKGEDLGVSLGPDPLTLSTVSAPRPDQTWGYLSLSAIHALGPGMFLSLSGSSSLGLNGSTGFVGTLALKGEL
ncbi:MAG: autotransporter domain-containing protein [Pseudomonadota bacterium]